jgi:hypothetical protein
MRKNTVLVVLLVLLVSFSISGANHISVPVNHRVYKILDVGRIRGLYDQNLVSVKPYPASTVIALLTEMAEHSQALSAGEREEITSLLVEFERTYGTGSSGVEDLFSTGYLRFGDEERSLGASFGIKVESTQTVDLTQFAEFDSRNAVKAFLRGDIGPQISFNMDFALSYDRLRPAAFMANEFTIPGEGFYMDLFHGGHPPSNIPFDGHYFGLATSPELAGSFFDGDVLLRWASIKRDWGPGANNLLISSTAREFDGIELQLAPTSWFRYALVHGSLGKFSTSSFLGKEYNFPSDYFGGSKESKIHYRFNNNFSAHRVELDIGKDLTFALYESVVWQKRFELGYLNPFSIFMFEQNNQGDIDSMFAGLDLSYNLLGKARLYGSVAVNEMSKIGNPIAMLKFPRNMFAFQLGAVIPLPIGNFSSLTAQWTYIGPWVYTHYPLRKLTGSINLKDDPATASIVTETGRIVTYTKGGSIDLGESPAEKAETITLGSDNEWFTESGRTRIVRSGGFMHIYETYAETFYVNKGEKIGYPLQPNSQEFLLALDLGLAKGWGAQAELKYQIRSGQYGFDIEQFMDYSFTKDYLSKNFWGYTFQHTLSLMVAGSKKIVNMPITLSASYRLIADWHRPIKKINHFDGRDTEFGSWVSADLQHILQVGVKIYY